MKYIPDVFSEKKLRLVGYFLEVLPLVSRNLDRYDHIHNSLG